VITDHLALPVPSWVDAQISLSDLEWSGGGGSELRYPNVFGAVTVWGEGQTAIRVFTVSAFKT